MAFGSGGTGALAWGALGGCVAGCLPAGARWLRVAQREHYIAGSTSRFAFRWWQSRWLNRILGVAAVAGVVASGRWPASAFAVVAVALVAPIGLGIRGRTSPLVFTARLKRLLGLWALFEAVVFAVGSVLGAPAPFGAAGLVAVPVVVDLALAVTGPVERHLTEPFVRSAAERLRRVAPRVVAITGSYGKTSTKNHVAHLVEGTRSVLATPGSFNNRGGLARSVNEHLAEGTDVFVAEMGTYGRGEIRDLCSWCTPEIAVITAIGPVHLERFGSEDAILVAKAEITEHARTVVVNADDPRLARLAQSLATRDPGLSVVTCSAHDVTADVCVLRSDEDLDGAPPDVLDAPDPPDPPDPPDAGDTAGALGALDAPDALVDVVVAGVQVARRVVTRRAAQPGNLACALAVAVALGVPVKDAVARLETLPAVQNRMSVGTAPSGVVVVDDTYNSNPAGSRAALALLESLPVHGSRVVVTPGMVELGRRQAEENARLAGAVCAMGAVLVVVGRTNRRALVSGGGGSLGAVVGTREDAVGWVRAHLGEGDAVLYENDLPDHYP